MRLVLAAALLIQCAAAAAHEGVNQHAISHQFLHALNGHALIALVPIVAAAIGIAVVLWRSEKSN